MRNFITLKSYMQDITSRQNKNVKNWIQCLESNGIQTHHRAILAGKKIVMDALQRHSEKVCAILIPKTRQESRGKDSEWSSSFARAKSAEIFRLSSEIFKELDIFGTNEPLLLVDVPSIEEMQLDSYKKLKGCTLWLTFQDPKNVGAVLRSASNTSYKLSLLVLKGKGVVRAWSAAG